MNKQRVNPRARRVPAPAFRGSGQVNRFTAERQRKILRDAGYEYAIWLVNVDTTTMGWCLGNSFIGTRAEAIEHWKKNAQAGTKEEA